MLSAALSQLLIQFTFFSYVLAAPVTIQENAWKYGSGGGIIGLIVLVLDIVVARKFKPLHTHGDSDADRIFS